MRSRCSVSRARQGQTWAVVAVPRLLTCLVGPGELPLGRAAWQDTSLLLPGVDPALRMRNVFTGEMLSLAESAGKSCLRLAEVFASFPVALFEAVGGSSAVTVPSSPLPHPSRASAAGWQRAAYSASRLRL